MLRYSYVSIFKNTCSLFMSQNRFKGTIPGHNHILYQSARDIRDISAPLDQYFSIKEFTYERIYPNNYKIKLTNQPEWISYFYEKSFYLIGDHTIDELKPGLHLTENMKNMNGSEPIFNSCKAFYQIGDGVLLIDDFKEYKELYWFTSDLNQHRIDFFNNLHLLRIFTNYFKTEAARIIKQAEQQKILRPIRPEQTLTPHFHSEVNVAGFLRSIQSKKYIFNNLTLTRKELKCAIGLISGKSAREIATQMSRSTRTIEAHIDRIKSKMDCYSKSALIEALLHTGIDIYLHNSF